MAVCAMPHPATSTEGVNVGSEMARSCNSSRVNGNHSMVSLSKLGGKPKFLLPATADATLCFQMPSHVKENRSGGHGISGRGLVQQRLPPNRCFPAKRPCVTRS